MTPFATRAKKSAVSNARRDLVPPGFEALADALDGEGASGAVTAVVQEIGRQAGRDGAPLDDVLNDLAMTYAGSRLPMAVPPFAVARALASAWADASLRYLHAVSCEDPLTGLSSLAHVRTRIMEIYREAAKLGLRGTPPHTLLVIELKWPESCSGRLDRLLRMIDVAEMVRSVYTGDETVGQLNASRVVAVVRRDRRIGDSVASLLGLMQDWQAEDGLTTRLWIEGLPSSASSAEVLLDELAR